MLRLLCLLALLLPRFVLAECASEAFWVWPPTGHALPANGQIVLVGYQLLQEPVAQIARSAPRLVAEKDEVPLRVVAVYRGELRLTQAVLRPERPLLPGRRYTLHLTQPKEAKGPLIPDQVRTQDGKSPIAWTVSHADVTPPRWREVPRKVSESVELMGCGPEVFVNVSASVDDDGSQVQMLAEVQDSVWGEPVRFRLTPYENEVALGHNMCAGAFRFAEGARYTVRLIAVDMAGNATPAPGGTLPFEGPSYDPE
jgi:hypothetical protein